MKKKLLVLIIISIVLLTGCGKKPTTGAEFKKESENGYGMKESESISAKEGLGEVKSKKVIKMVGDDWTSYFYKFSSEEKAVKVIEDLKDDDMTEYGKQKKHFERVTSMKKTDDIITKDGYGRGVDMSTSAKIYKIAVRVEDTIIFVESKPLTFENEDSVPDQIGGYLSIFGYYD